jgi:hypothetical protein
MTPRPRSLLLLLLEGFIAVSAQSPPVAGAITGTVIDQDAASLGGAQVTLKGDDPIPGPTPMISSRRLADQNATNRSLSVIWRAFH